MLHIPDRLLISAPYRHRFTTRVPTLAAPPLLQRIPSSPPHSVLYIPRALFASSTATPHQNQPLHNTKRLATQFHHYSQALAAQHLSIMQH